MTVGYASQLSPSLQFQEAITKWFITVIMSDLSLWDGHLNGNINEV